MVTNGTAYSLGGDCYQLTITTTGQAGSIFSSSTIDLTEAFVIEATLNFGNNDGGADGIVFVLTTSNTALGGTGGSIAYDGISPSLGVEFDTWQNGNLGDPAADHVAILSNGNNNHNADLEGPVALGNLEDGQDHCFTASWDPGTQEFLTFIDGNLVMTYNGDISIHAGSTDVYYGFTASTGGAVNNQSVCVSVAELIPMEDQEICPGESVTLTADPNGVSYEWNDPNGSLSDINSANPTASPDETTLYEVSITYACDAVLVDDVLVNVLPEVDFNYNPVPDFCESDGPFTFVITPLGGSWSGDVDASGSFDPALLGPGSFKAIYTYIDPTTDCLFEECFAIEIFEDPVLSILVDDQICQSESFAVIQIFPGNGDLFIDDEEYNDGIFYPADLEPGIHYVYYSFENSADCYAEILDSFEILPQPQVAAGPSGIYCQSDSILQLIGNPPGGTWSGITNGNSINLNTLEEGTHYAFYSYMDNNGCVGIDTADIYIQPRPSLEINGTIITCEGFAPAFAFDVPIDIQDSLYLILSNEDGVLDTVFIEGNLDTLRYLDEGQFTIAGCLGLNGCPGDCLGNISKLEIPKFELTDVSISCDETDENYFVHFRIAAQVDGSFSINGPNIMNEPDGSYTAGPLANHDEYEIIVADIFGCLQDTLKGSYSCMCEEFLPTSLIPNPSFEELNCCPMADEELFCAVGWIQASEPTTDFLHECGITAHPELGFEMPRPLPDGMGAIGFRDGLFFNPNFKEYAGACLTQSMDVGKSYTLKFDIGFHSHWASQEVALALFATTDCNNLPFGVGDLNYGCPTNGPDWVQLDAASFSGTDEWVEARFTFTAQESYEAIVLGPACEANPNYNFDPYYFFDNLILGESDEFGIPIISVEGNICSDSLHILSADIVDGIYQWYKNGIAIPGANDIELIIDADDPDPEGSYSLIITTEQSCFLGETFDVILPVYESFPVIELCPGDSYLLGDTLITSEGIYNQILLANDGCDSLIQLNVIELDNSSATIDTVICAESTIILNDEVFSDPGLYTQQLNNVQGCDSIIQLNLSHYTIPSDTIVASICEGEFFDWNGQLYNEDGFHAQTLTAAQGCDSISVLSLDVRLPSTSSIVDTLCDGESIIINDEVYTVSGSYEQSLVNAQNCDSTILITLEFILPTSQTVVGEICQGDSILYNGQWYSEEGSYLQTLTADSGCDSLLSIIVNQINVEEGTLDVAKCLGDQVVINGITYIDQGQYIQDLTASNGCDSSLLLNIVDILPDTVYLYETVCDTSLLGLFDSMYTSQFGCDSLVITDISLSPSEECGLEFGIDVPLISCLSNSDTLFISISNGIGPYQYTLTEINGGLNYSGELTMASNNSYYIPEIGVGSYTVEIVSSDGYFASSSFTIEMAAGPAIVGTTVSTYGNSNTSCSDSEDGWISIDDIQGGAPPYTYIWSTGSEEASINNVLAGYYTVTITDQNGCIDSTGFTLLSPEILQASAEVIHPLCFGDANGSIIVFAEGGTPPYSYSIENLATSMEGSFSELSAGEYTMVITDQNECSISITAVLIDPDPVYILLDKDTTIAWGTSLDLSYDSNIPSSQIENIEWFANGDLACSNCENLEVSPTEDILVTVTIISENGCESRDEQLISIYLIKDVYVPNVFSPNAQGNNAFFTLDGNFAMVLIPEIMIYDRWGNLMFEGENLEPGIAEQGWDGTFNGHNAMEGVYTFIALVNFVDGSQQRVSGDVTLIR